MRATTKATVARARTLRRTLTKPEAVLWQILRTRPGGFKFRRQHPIGPFVLDFYCPETKLAIEVDGSAHDMGDNPRRDDDRDAWLKGRGLTVLRVPAVEVLTAVEPVVFHIVAMCGSQSPSTGLQPVPLPIASRQGG
jgi:very-short-patch-repair endonuclease